MESPPPGSHLHLLDAWVGDAASHRVGRVSARAYPREVIFSAFGNSSFNTFIIKSRGPNCDGRGITAYTFISMNRTCPEFSRLLQRDVTFELHQQPLSGCFIPLIIGNGKQLLRGTWWCSWLRYCAASRNLAGSIPDGVIWVIDWAS